MPRARIGTANGRPLSYELNTLTKHAAVLGTTGSGKTVLCKVLVEECLLRGIPVVAVDPKGDIGSLAVTDKQFDFRPFAKKAEAERAAKQYRAAHGKERAETLRKLAATRTTIYTPKGSAGEQVSLFPDLRAPKLERTEAATFVDTVSASLLQLAGVTGGAREKAQSFISTILLHEWQRQRDLDVNKLVALIQEPPFSEIGSLPVDDYMKEPERKRLAAQLNLLLTSPSKQVWRQGAPLDPKALLTKGRLSVVDLRSTHGEETQFVVEQLLQELYRFLVRQRGSEKLRYVLYIDELAGLLPPPPANPPCKRLLELLIRQARAFGLGIIVATQNPGDIDYKLLGNLGTRFVGKLRTQNDIEKVATATGLATAELRDDIGALRTGGFVLNDGVKNTTRTIQARWLYTYHRGPLSPKEIGWVNDPRTAPKPEGTLAVPEQRPARKRPAKRVSAQELLKVAPRAKRAARRRTRRTEDVKRKDTALAELIRDVKRLSDSTQLRVALSDGARYAPHLKLVVEPERRKGLPLELQGPFVFDLTAKLIPIGNYLKHYTWRQTVPRELQLVPATRSLQKAFDHAVREARRELTMQYYASTLTGAQSADRDAVEERNKEYLTAKLADDIAREERATRKATEKAERALATARRKEKELSRKLLGAKTKRALQRVVRRPRERGAQERRWATRRRELVREQERLKKSIARERERLRRMKERLKERGLERAASAIRVRSYRPSRDDLHVHATILLVPARGE